MAQNRDLVDLTLSVNINVGLSYGSHTPDEAERERRKLHVEAIEKWKETTEASLADHLSEILGYDKVTLVAKMEEREVTEAKQDADEKDGRDLRSRQRAGRG